MIPHDLLDIGNVIVVVLLTFVGLKIKNAILSNKIEIIGEIAKGNKEQSLINNDLRTHMAIDIREHKELFERVEKTEKRINHLRGDD